MSDQTSIQLDDPSHETDAKGIGWAIIGIGRLADLFIAPAIAHQPDSRLVAVCSRSLDRARDFTARHGGEPYDDYARMLAHPGVDVVYVATPNAVHTEHVGAALAAGHHVFVDKPMTLSSDDGRRLVTAAANAGRLLGVAFQLRHKATNRAARTVLADGVIGAVRFADLVMGAGHATFPYHTWRSDPALAGGGTMLNQGTHAFDLLRFLTGGEIVAVTCATSAPELEDVMVATCELTIPGVARRMLATVSTHGLGPGPQRNWHVVGEQGWLEGRGALSPKPDDALILHAGGTETVLATSTVSAYDAEVDAFTAAVLGRAPLDGDGTDGVRNAAVVEALYRAARQRRRVEVDLRD